MAKILSSNNCFCFNVKALGLNMKIIFSTIGLLFCMPFAWYMHLKNLKSQPIFIVILIGWV